MSTIDDIKSLQLMFDCGINQAKLRNLNLQDAYGTNWGLAVNAISKRWIISNKRTVFPLALILEGRKYRSGYPSRDFSAVTKLHVNNIIEPFLCGFQARRDFSASYEETYQNHLFNLGRYYLNKHMGVDLPFPVRPTWKAFSNWENPK